MDNNFLFLCVLQVTLAYEKYSAIYVSGKVLMDNQTLSTIISETISLRTKLYRQ